MIIIYNIKKIETINIKKPIEQETIHTKTYKAKCIQNMFDSIKDGPIKADIFRICILAKYGGVYSDIDNIILEPLDNIIKNNIKKV